MDRKTFKLFGYEAIITNNRIEVSVPDELEANKILMRIYKGILDGKLESIRITLPATQYGVVGRHIFLSRESKANSPKAELN